MQYYTKLQKIKPKLLEQARRCERLAVAKKKRST